MLAHLRSLVQDAAEPIDAPAPAAPVEALASMLLRARYAVIVADAEPRTPGEPRDRWGVDGVERAEGRRKSLRRRRRPDVANRLSGRRRLLEGCASLSPVRRGGWCAAGERGDGCRAGAGGGRSHSRGDRRGDDTCAAGADRSTRERPCSTRARGARHLGSRHPRARHGAPHGRHSSRGGGGASGATGNSSDRAGPARAYSSVAPQRRGIITVLSRGDQMAKKSAK